MTISEPVVAKHLRWMQVRNLRANSVYNRRRTLARFTRWNGGPILYVTEDRLREWQAERALQIGAPALRGEMSALREFYRWCVREDLRADDPTVRLDLPRVPRRLPRPMADEDLAHAISEATPVLAAVLGLACFAGLRAWEVAGLDWSHVVLTGERHLRVEDGKGGKGRLVPLSPALVELLHALPHRRGPVVPRWDGKAGPNRAHNISHHANDYLHGLGIPDTLHQARHRFATATYAACRDIRAVQDLLGHASPTTTSVYAAVSPEVAVRAVVDAGRLAA